MECAALTRKISSCSLKEKFHNYLCTPMYYPLLSLKVSPPWRCCPSTLLLFFNMFPKMKLAS